jgi:hypothetical protein
MEGLHMRIITAAAAAAVLAVVSAPSFAESVASVPSDFELIGTPTGAAAQGLPDVYFNLSLNPLPLPSAPLEGTGLSLANATNPVYHYPGSTGVIQLNDFSFGVAQTADTGSQSKGSGKEGKVTVGDIVVTKGSDSASAKLFIDVLGVQGLETQYTVSLLFTGLDPGSLATSTAPPITPCSPPLCAFEDFVFTLPAPTDDPDVAFSVMSGSTSYSFSAVPEPPVWTLLALALVLLGCRPREKSRFIP